MIEVNPKSEKGAAEEKARVLPAFLVLARLLARQAATEFVAKQNEDRNQ